MTTVLLSRGISTLDEIVIFLRQNDCSVEASTLEVLLQRVQKRMFHLAVVGGYNRGKSTLINALLGAEVLPSANQPTTSVITYLCAAEKLAVRIGKDGNPTRQFRTVPELQQFLSTISSSQDTNQEVTVYYPFSLEQGVMLIDTPGFNHAYEVITQSALHQGLVDGLLVVFSTQEQAESEVQFYKYAAGLFPVFCVLNRIDNINSVEDIEKNTEYFWNIVSSFSTHFSLISGYLGLKGRVWAHYPEQFQVAKATERKFRTYSNPQEVLRESRFEEFEAALQRWLLRRDDWQLWRGIRLAQLGLERLQQQVETHLSKARELYNLQASETRHQINEINQREHLLQMAMYTTENLLTSSVAQVWRLVNAQVVMHFKEEVRKKVRSFIVSSRTTDLKQNFTAKANSAWKEGLASIQRTLLELTRYTKRQLCEKVEQDYGMHCCLPDFDLALPISLQNPWTHYGSAQLTTATRRILAKIEVLDAPIAMTLGLTMGIIFWNQLAGTKKQLQDAFDQEVVACIDALQALLNSSRDTWELNIKQQIQEKYQHLSSQYQQKGSQLGISLQKGQEELKKWEQHAHDIRLQTKEFGTTLDLLFLELMEIIHF